MKFQDLYMRLNEVPHHDIPETVDRNGVRYIDYHVEDWYGDIELKRSFVNLLSQLNKEEIILDVKDGLVVVHDEYGTRSFLEHPRLVHDIAKHNLTPNQFNDTIVSNYEKFEYVKGDNEE